MLFLKQSTASQSVLIGAFVDDTDGATAETGLSIANTDIRLSKNGGNMAAKNSGGGTHDENGWYSITLDATDTDTVGRLQVSVKVSGALAVWAEFWVLEEAIYDALFAASAGGFDSSAQVTVGTFATGAITADAIAADAIGSSELAATAVTEIRDAVTGGAYALDTDANGRIRIVDGTGAGELDTDTGTVLLRAATEAQIDAIETDTAEIGAAGAGLTEAGGTGDHLTAIPWNASWDAEVQSEVNDGLVAFFTSSAQLVDDIWDEVITGANHNTNNSSAKFLRESAETVAIRTGTAQAGASTTITLDANASSTDDIYNRERVSIIEGTGVGQGRVIVDYDGTTKVATVDRAWTTNPDSSSVFAVTPADADLATVRGVLAEATSGELHARDSSGNTFDATTFSTHSAADVRTEMDSNSTQLAAIVADTNELQTDDVPGLIAALNDFDPANDTVANVTTVGSVTTKTGYSLASTGLDLVTAWTVDITGSLSGSVGSVTGNVGGNVTGSIGSLATQAKADVNAEVVDVIQTDTATELSSVPAASPALHTMVQLVYQATRNKIDVTSNAKEVHTDGGSVLGTKTLSDDGTTYSESKMA